MIDNDILKKLQRVQRHIALVQKAAGLLVERLLDTDDEEQKLFAIHLMAKVMEHDQSKFIGIEWEALHIGADPEMLKLAHKQHVATNDHHPEYWNGINNMPEICIAEMVCDWKTRSDEMGTGLRDWIKNDAAERFGFSLKGTTYKKIKKYVDLLLDEPFKEIKHE